MKKIIWILLLSFMLLNVNSAALAFSRTPAEMADVIKDKIQGKVVYDIGCAEGDWMIAMSKYASEVKGVDSVTKSANVASDRGLTVLNADVASEGFVFPLADVYYVYVTINDLNRIMKKIDTSGVKGTFIFGSSGFYIADEYFILRGAEVRSGAGGHFKVYILTIN